MTDDVTWVGYRGVVTTRLDDFNLTTQVDCARLITSALRPNIFADPNMAKKSANQNPLLLNAEACSPPREVCGACSFLCILLGCNKSALTTAPFTVSLHDYNPRLRTQTVSCWEH